MTQAVVKLLDEKLVLYLRDNSKSWYARFSYKRVVYQKSMLTVDPAVAKDRATKWYYKRQVELEHGIAPAIKKNRFETVAQLAMTSYKTSRRSRSYVVGVEKILDKSVIPLIGKMDICDVSHKTWEEYKQHVSPRKLSPTTLHQHENAIKIVITHAYKLGLIKNIPRFVNDINLNKDATPRTWFDKTQLEVMLKGARENIIKLEKTRWHEDAQELLDFIEIGVYSGLRIGELKSIRFRDIEMVDSGQTDDPVETDDDLFQPASYLIIKNIMGKRGTGTCRVNYEATPAFARIWERRIGLEQDYHTSDELLFVKYHRDMFRELLIKLNLRYTDDRPRKKRDLGSLRSTYACHRILAGVDVYLIARNMRTSVQMIENHYSRWLSPMLMNVNRYIR